MSFASRVLVPGLAVAALLLAPAMAQAAPACGQGGTCPAGTQCKVLDDGVCPDCAGANCPPCAPPRSFCMADHIACESDLDCPGYLVCMQTTVQTSCPGCPEPAPLPKKETHTCVFKERTCTAESDCADGLLCTPSQGSVCSGGGGEPPTCTPDAFSLCTFQAITCETAADCPCDFACDFVGIGCNAQDGSCGVTPQRYCRALGVSFSVSPDGKWAGSDIISSSHESRQAADGRGNKGSVCARKAAGNGSTSSGPPATDPGCALSASPTSDGGAPSTPARLGLVGLIGLFALRIRARARR